MYRYQVANGHEHLTFAGQGVKNLGNGIVESDHELSSPYLTMIEELEQQAHTMEQTPSPDEQVPPQTPSQGEPSA